jgi:predicted transcriptional regulator
LALANDVVSSFLSLDRGLAMSTLSLRLPESLHKQVRELAKKEGISINQFLATAVAEKMSALMTEEYLESRAKRGSREAFERAMGKVKKRAPNTGDEI